MVVLHRNVAQLAAQTRGRAAAERIDIRLHVRREHSEFDIADVRPAPRSWRCGEGSGDGEGGGGEGEGGGGDGGGGEGGGGKGSVRGGGD